MSKRSWWVVLMMFALGFSWLSAGAHADELQMAKARGKLIVGIRNDYVPFGYLDNKGHEVGFEVDLAKFIAKDMFGSDTAIEFVPVVASNRIELLNAGRIDVIFATLGKNPDRAKVIDFTDPYYMMAGMVLLAPKNTTITKWEDLKGRKICGSQGNMYNRTLQEKLGADTVLFTGTAQMYKAFEDNRCEAIAYDGPNLTLKANEPGWKDKDKIALDAFEFVPIVGGVRKNEPAFLNALNQSIKKAEAAGVLVNAEKRYNMGTSKFVTEQQAAASK
ncbi:bacterial extracellular solute-binding s, 3 family protein [Paraburkholderia xenovorans LB400]|uniref:Amino acid ABC transporter substrate-binding protein, PAAT family n=1 Tax=Paraburkholderia xenovorans (strain LB400) TaxID=266265 RepID=Q13ZF3_PARXL|nr:transporter substrate-binding domain-containing protein [Paraburkholderia xenovorans]ABE30536.1 amino acid ABC transporter substrate-binding protein, PAAT family [Paraburkholderia xenovorans LB400]AIP32170.1 bacterial extracellular solute-binding s, 3 family protein [Paraburkholderia xenovorans LB400]